jgi:hypothetical protein
MGAVSAHGFIHLNRDGSGGGPTTPTSILRPCKVTSAIASQNRAATKAYNHAKEKFMTYQYVLIEGPHFTDDAGFFGQWLLAAEKGDQLWDQAIEDRAFAAEVDKLTLLEVFKIFFCEKALSLLTQWTRKYPAFVFPIDCPAGQSFPVMAQLGFFALTGPQPRYRMTIPTNLDISVLKAMTIKLIGTLDVHKHWLHPEYLVETISPAEAKSEIKKLRELSKLTAYFAT